MAAFTVIFLVVEGVTYAVWNVWYVRLKDVTRPEKLFYWKLRTETGCRGRLIRAFLPGIRVIIHTMAGRS